MMQTAETDAYQVEATDGALPPADPSPAFVFHTDIDTELVRARVRLPNQFQQDEIRKKAQAARTRAVRLLKDPESDLYCKVEAMLEGFEEYSDDGLLEYLIGEHLSECMARARAVIETADVEKRPEWAEFANISEHREAYQRLQAAGDDADPDQLRASDAIFLAYGAALREVTEELLEPSRVKYDCMSREERIYAIRRHASKAESDQEFLREYSKWTMYFGCRKLDNPNTTFYESIDAMLDAPDEELQELRVALEALEIADPKALAAVTPSSPTSD